MVALRVLPILFPFSQLLAPTSRAEDRLSLQQEPTLALASVPPAASHLFLWRSHAP